MRVSIRLCLIVIFSVLGACRSETPSPTLVVIPLTPLSSTPSSTQVETPAASISATPIASAANKSIVIGAVGAPAREVTALPRFIADALYDSLLQVDPNTGALKPGLADSWQVSEDARSFSFHLRANLLWHDGQPLTARDAVFTIKALSDPKLRLASAVDFGSLSDVTAPDAQTVLVKLSETYCAALTNLGMLKILPAHILTNQNLAALKPEHFIGSGPLVLKEWNSNQLTFTRNPNYWNGAPAITDWSYNILANETEARSALSAGKIDLLASDARRRDDLPAATDLKIYQRTLNQFYALAFNYERDFLAEARVRQAFAAALDRPQLANQVYGGESQLLQQSFLKEFWATPPNVAQPAYDPAEARELLQEAGWRDSDHDGVLEKNGKPLRVLLFAQVEDATAELLAQAVRAQLAQIGVQARLQLDDESGFYTRVFLHEYDLAIVWWNIPLDPDQHWFWQSSENTKGQGFNISSYSNAQVDNLLKQGNRAPRCDPETRRAIYAEAYSAIAADAPQIFLLAPPAYIGARANVHGVAPSSFAGSYWNMNAWQVLP